MPKLFVRTTLSDFDKTELLQRRDDLPRLEHRQLDHVS